MKKGFIKKISTICLAVLLGITTTGCSNGVKVDNERLETIMDNFEEYLNKQNSVDQDKLDELLDSFQEYLDKQNVYSGDEEKEYLSNLLSKNIVNLEENFINMSVDYKISNNDIFGNLIDLNELTYKFYKNGNTVKKYFKESGEDESYIVANLIKNSTEYKYQITTYDIATKKYNVYVYDMNEELEEGLAPAYHKNVMMMDSLLNMGEHYENILEKVPNAHVTMEKQDDEKITFNLILEGKVTSKLTFENGLLITLEEKGESKDSSLFEGDSYSKMNVQYNIANFEIENLESYTQNNN